MIQNEWLFLAGATLLHVVGVPVARAIAPEPPRVERVAVQRGQSEVDVDVDDAFVRPDPLPRDHDDTPLGMRDGTGPHNPDFDPDKPATLTRGGRRGEGPKGPGDPVLSAPEGTSSDNDTFNPDGDWSNAPGPGEVWGTPGVDHDLPYWALPGAPGIETEGGGDGPAAPTRTKKRKHDPDAATKAVSDGVRAKDGKLGLDFPGRGPIRAAFSSATYSADTPYESQAMFGLAVDPKGNVTQVRYVSHTGGTAGTWKKVAAAAAAQLKGTKLVMKSAFKKGATVSVVVVSKKKTPGGGASRDGATINFDVTDVGAKATRIVNVSVAPSPVK